MGKEIKNVRNRFEALKEQMESLRENTFERKAFLYFDISSWLEAKIENRPLQDFVKEKVKLRMKKVA